MNAGDAILKLQGGRDMTPGESAGVLSEMLRGGVDDRTCARLLDLLGLKGETDGEILGMLGCMREFMTPVPVRADGPIDVCGTGGDGLRTINVSTAAAFVAAAAGVPVAKHGNRSNSGVSGSADVFEYLGYDLRAGPEEAAGALSECNLCFLFGQRFHPALRNVAPARRLVPRRTIFNILGPLANPAGVRRQLVGVSEESLLERLPRILARGGSEYAMAVMAANGMDEFSTASANHVRVAGGGRSERSVVYPWELGLRRSQVSDIAVGTRRQAMDSFLAVLAGSASRAMTETVALNAAAALVTGGRADGFGDALDSALDAIDSGRARSHLARFLEGYGDPAVLEGVP